jgi:hypothetical protein
VLPWRKTKVETLARRLQGLRVQYGVLIAVAAHARGLAQLALRLALRRGFAPAK